MTSNRTAWWIAYAASAIVLVAVLAWVSAMVLSLERSEVAANAQAGHEASVRDALGRMDSIVGPILIREAARPHYEYSAYYQPDAMYDASYNTVPRDVCGFLNRSPLLTFDAEYSQLHFQLDRGGTLSSPQVPIGQSRDLAVTSCVADSSISTQESRLDDIAQYVSWDELDLRLRAAEAGFRDMINVPPAPPPVQVAAQTEGTQWMREQTNVESAKRAQSLGNVQKTIIDSAITEQTSQIDVGPEQPTVQLGALFPVWLTADDELGLFLVRRVMVGDREVFQGLMADWPQLETLLVAEIDDLFPVATLLPVEDPAEPLEPPLPMLSSLPAALSVPGPPPASISGITPARTTLMATWTAMLLALVIAGFTLHASIAFGDRRSRFASAVTHELRTPLTTFRLYAEMLADGMIADPAKRQTYLETLRDESGRLSSLIENVLSYARLEQGRTSFRREATTLSGLLKHIAPPLERRADESGATLAIEATGDASAPLVVDIEAVGQVLFNLVDNACKYATNGTRAAIQVTADVNGDALRLRVHDDGPGVASGRAQCIFSAYDRGDIQPGDTIPGVGLGLAVSRGLARGMQGDLALETPPDGHGACFVLCVPARTSAAG